MRADRLISLVLLLRNRGRMTAPQLAAELEVSERTVLRDIDALSTSGFPVFAERGRHGGFELLPGFTTDLTGLTVAEATALLSADASASLGMSREFASAMRKVAAALPENRRKIAVNVAERVLVRPDGWLCDPERDEHLGAVQDALFAGRRLRMIYGDKPGERTVDPIGLVYAGIRWYLLATHNGNDRTYRVSRIKSAAATDEPAVRDVEVDLAALWDARRDRFRSLHEVVDAGLRVRETRRTDVEANVVEVHAVTEEGNGWLRMDVVLGGPGHACSLAWMLGGDGEIIGPDSLRSAVRERAQQLSSTHSDTGRAGEQSLGRAHRRHVEVRNA